MRPRLALVALCPFFAACSMLPIDLPGPGDLPSLGPTTVAPGSVACTHGAQYYLTTSGDYILSGSCDLVMITGDRIRVTSPDGFGTLTIEGNGNTANAKDTGAVTIKGARNEVAVGGTGLVTIDGGENRLDLAKAGLVAITGDGNTVEVDEDLGAITLDGNRNTVMARNIGSTTDNGTGNTVRQR